MEQASGFNDSLAPMRELMKVKGNEENFSSNQKEKVSQKEKVGNNKELLMDEDKTQETMEKSEKVILTEQNTINKLKEKKEDQIKENENQVLYAKNGEKKEQKNVVDMSQTAGSVPDISKEAKSSNLGLWFCGIAIGFGLFDIACCIICLLFPPLAPAMDVCASVCLGAEAGFGIAGTISLIKGHGKNGQEIPGGSGKQQINGAGGVLNFLGYRASGVVVPLKQSKNAIESNKDSKKPKSNATNNHNYWGTQEERINALNAVRRS